MEQATHFVDMMRYLGGEIDRESIQAIAVGPDYPLAEMPKHPEGENLVSLQQPSQIGPCHAAGHPNQTPILMTAF